MAHFLLVYDRSAGALVTEECYDVRGDALRARFAAEEKYAAQDQDVEIVVLDADSRDQLLTTHARYFLNMHELAARIA